VAVSSPNYAPIDSEPPCKGLCCFKIDSHEVAQSDSNSGIVGVEVQNQVAAENQILDYALLPCSAHLFQPPGEGVFVS
jgi:hypothetical protein